MTEEEERKNELVATIAEVKRKVEEGEMTSGEGYAYMYGYVCALLQNYIGKFDSDLYETKS